MTDYDIEFVPRRTKLDRRVDRHRENSEWKNEFSRFMNKRLELTTEDN